MFAFLVVPPFASSPAVTYLLALSVVIVALVINRQHIRRQHRRDPRIIRIGGAFLFAVVLAVAGAVASVPIQQCSPQWITQTCGEGESWCRSYWEWSCWLMDAMY